MDKLYPGFRCTLTQNRKVVVVKSRELDPNKAKDVALMMCHSERTADNYYDVRSAV